MVGMAGMDHLATATRGQYARAFRWLQREYHGPYERTEPIQSFLNDHPKCSGIRGRIIQSLVNRHLTPHPQGPPITIVQPPHPRRAGNHKRLALGVWAQDHTGWMAYVPDHLKAAVVHELGPPWQVWLPHYIGTTLRANPLKRNLVRAYVTHVYHVMWEHLRCTCVEDVLRVKHPAVVQAVTDSNPLRSNQRRLCRIAVNHFLGGTVLREHPVAALRLQMKAKDFAAIPADGDDDGEHPAEYAVRAPGRIRDHFTQSEMDVILHLPNLSLRDRLMLHIMAETGLRRRAVSWLLVDGVYDRTSQACLPVARALEKGMVMRPFALSRRTADLLHGYMRDEHPGPHTRWLFPSCKKGNMYPVTPSVVNNVLLRACALANIRGRHTHTHAIRKFVVCTLMQHHNRIEGQAAVGLSKPRAACPATSLNGSVTALSTSRSGPTGTSGIATSHKT
jgi:hypothetical protein